MRVSQADILFVPGYQGSGPEHWQTRWERRLSTARRVEQADWTKPVRAEWTHAVAEAVNDATTRPVVIVAHSLGVPTAVLAAPLFRRPVAGAFLVAPPDVANPNIRPQHLMTFGPYPVEPLPFPAMVVASRNDPYCDFPLAESIAAGWGASFVDAGLSGHINTESGHGPWPEGLLTFGKFVSRLSTDPLGDGAVSP